MLILVFYFFLLLRLLSDEATNFTVCSYMPMLVVNEVNGQNKLSAKKRQKSIGYRNVKQTLAQSNKVGKCYAQLQ